MKNQKKIEWIISNNQINEEIGLGRTRTEMNDIQQQKEFDLEAHFPSKEEEAIFNELGLGKNCFSEEISILENPSNSNQ